MRQHEAACIFDQQTAFHFINCLAKMLLRVEHFDKAAVDDAKCLSRVVGQTRWRDIGGWGARDDGKRGASCESWCESRRTGSNVRWDRG